MNTALGTPGMLHKLPKYDDVPIFNKLIELRGWDHTLLNRGIDGLTRAIYLKPVADMVQGRWDTKPKTSVFGEIGVEESENGESVLGIYEGFAGHVGVEEGVTTEVEEYKGNYPDWQTFYKQKVEQSEEPPNFQILMNSVMVTRYVKGELTKGTEDVSEAYVWILLGYCGEDSLTEFGDPMHETWKANLYELGMFLKDKKGSKYETTEIPTTSKKVTEIKSLLTEQGNYGPVQVVCINGIQVPKKNFSAIFTLDTGEVVMKIRSGENQDRVFKMNNSDFITIHDPEGTDVTTVYKEVFDLI